MHGPRCVVDRLTPRAWWCCLTGSTCLHGQGFLVALRASMLRHVVLVGLNRPLRIGNVLPQRLFSKNPRAWSLPSGQRATALAAISRVRFRPRLASSHRIRIRPPVAAPHACVRPLLSGSTRDGTSSLRPFCRSASRATFLVTAGRVRVGLRPSSLAAAPRLGARSFVTAPSGSRPLSRSGASASRLPSRSVSTFAPCLALRPGYQRLALSGCCSLSFASGLDASGSLGQGWCSTRDQQRPSFVRVNARGFEFLGVLVLYHFGEVQRCRNFQGTQVSENDDGKFEGADGATRSSLPTRGM